MTLTFNETAPEQEVVVGTPEELDPIIFVIKRYQWGEELDMYQGKPFLEVKDPLEKKRRIIPLTEYGTYGDDRLRLWLKWAPSMDDYLGKTIGVRVGVMQEGYEEPVFLSRRFVLTMREKTNTTTLAEMLATASASEAQANVTEEN